MPELGLPEDIFNVSHPIGATGAVLMTRLLYSMRRRDGLNRGIVMLCMSVGHALAQNAFAAARLTA